MSPTSALVSPHERACEPSRARSLARAMYERSRAVPKERERERPFVWQWHPTFKCAYESRSASAHGAYLPKCEGILCFNSTHLWYSQRQLECHEAGQAVGEAGVGVKQPDQLQRAGCQHGGVGLQQLLQEGSAAF